MTLTALEHALVAAGIATRRSPFGRTLQQHHPGRRGNTPDKAFRWLANFELSLDPAVRRTLATLGAARLTGRDLALDDDDRSHLDWVSTLHRALQAVTDSFWGSIGPDIRALLIDEDDSLPLPFQPTYLIPELRVLHPPTLRTASRAVGMTEPDLAALSSVWREAQRTRTYAAAVAAASEVRRDRGIFRALAERRSQAFATVPAPSGLMTTYASAVLAHFGDAYASDQSLVTVAGHLRRYNRLTHASVVAWLGAAEDDRDRAPVELGDSPIDVLRRRDSLSVRVTVRSNAGPLWLRMTSPFVIDDDGPLDGVYLATGIQVQGFGSASITDLAGDRIRELTM